MESILNENAKEFLKIFAEIEFNATDDTLFQRITLARLRAYADKYFGTNLEELILGECADYNRWLSEGKDEKDWYRIRLQKRLKLFGTEGKQTP